MLTADNPLLIDPSKSVKRGDIENFSPPKVAVIVLFCFFCKDGCVSNRLSEFQCVICLLTCTNLCLSLVESSI